MESVNKGRIAKNTVFLYFRMLFVMVISLYTSRVILEILGIEDFGIYQSVGGIVGMMTFLNGALGTGISRFITFELGKNDPKSLKATFASTICLQLILIALIVIAAETVGLWFVNNKLQIPAENKNAALWAYHLSILTTAISLFSGPYVASIIAHERLNLFAYMGIYDVAAKLGVVYLLNIGNINHLIFYAFLLLLVQASNTIFYLINCLRNFPECRCFPSFHAKIFKQIGSFSGWSLFANMSIALNGQGVIVLLNMFFSPAVVTARTISLQVNAAANNFVSNFRVAVNPQIVKQYAATNYEESKSLLLSSTKFSYYMMLLLAIPIFMAASPLLHVWLKEVPQYTVIFLQLVIVQSLFQVFDTSFYTALYAKGDLKLNALISPTIGFLMFPIVYIMFKMGASPIALSWASLILYAILGLIVKPILIIKIVKYTWTEIFNVYKPCLTVTLVAGSISYLLTRQIDDNGFAALCKITAICLGICIPTIYFLGLSKPMKDKLKNAMLKKLRD